MSLATFIDRVSDLAAAGVLASFGGAAQALYQIYKNERPFALFPFFICIFLSFFVGQVVGSLIPSSLSQYHDGLLLMSGFCVFPLLDIINSHMSRYMKGVFEKALPTNPQDQNDSHNP